jgi:transposase
MPKPYSYDLRQKVMQAIEMDGLKKTEASELFDISRNTINLWFKRRDETGDIKVKRRGSTSQQTKISNWEKFREFVKEHEDKTQAEMAELWGNISQRSISRALKQIGFTRKKKLMVIGSEMKKSGMNFAQQ